MSFEGLPFWKRNDGLLDRCSLYGQLVSCYLMSSSHRMRSSLLRADFAWWLSNSSFFLWGKNGVVSIRPLPCCQAHSSTVVSFSFLSCSRIRAEQEKRREEGSILTLWLPHFKPADTNAFESISPSYWREMRYYMIHSSECLKWNGPIHSRNCGNKMSPRARRIDSGIDSLICLMNSPHMDQLLRSYLDTHVDDRTEGICHTSRLLTGLAWWLLRIPFLSDGKIRCLDRHIFAKISQLGDLFVFTVYV